MNWLAQSPQPDNTGNDFRFPNEDVGLPRKNGTRGENKSFLSCQPVCKSERSLWYRGNSAHLRESSLFLASLI